MAKPLVIVESPAKARTIASFLGGDFTVESSIGHIRDLPRNAAEIPSKYKSEDWARLAVNTEEGFKPIYVVPKEKKEQVKKLKKLLADASELYLATDEDREGESIAWHLHEVLKPKVPVKRMVFHEITRPAIEEAVANPRDLDYNLISAQEARRILDRLYGFEVSPVLWKKIKPKLSAGRVQSVATRIIVQRERERIAFVAASYWGIETLMATENQELFGSRLLELEGNRIATGKDFDASASLSKDVAVLDEAAATELAGALEGRPASVASVERKPYRRKPYAPFMTSTLQQEASRKLRFSAARAMGAAQKLYENGFITYMRTDSTTLSEAALTMARSIIADLYGTEYMPDKPREYKKKVKNAQEAHEAIRPAGDTWQSPEDVSNQVSSDEARLYELIWMRTVASQMKDAEGESISVRMDAEAADGRNVRFATSGKTVTFAGFLRAYVEGSDDPDADRDDQERKLPELTEGQSLIIEGVEAKGHETKPPARFTEASLVKRLEELGVGRPSTYASIISTIQDRGYVWKRGSALIPSFTAFATVTLMEQHFDNLVDYTFTARMETDLDDIANGEEESLPWLNRFYFGNGETGLKELVAERLGEIDARAVNSIPIGEHEDQPVVARVGRYGPYLSHGERTAGLPENLPPDELTLDVALEILDAPSGDKILGTDPETGLTVLARKGRYGPYVQLGDLEELEEKEKPKTASLFKTMTIDEMSLDLALRLLELPRTLGETEDGDPIEALNGRYGPYIKAGKETRSLEEEEQLFTITVEEAKEILKQPKRRRGQRAPAAPLRELGEHPDSGKPIVVREGRFGPYVTDGEVNASLRKGDEPMTIDLDRALELLALRRQKLAEKG